MLSHFSRVQLFATLWIEPARLLCLWDSPGKNSGVGCHTLLQEILLTQECISCKAGGFSTTEPATEEVHIFM